MMDISKIIQLVKILENSELSEIEIKSFLGSKIRVTKYPKAIPRFENADITYAVPQRSQVQQPPTKTENENPQKEIAKTEEKFMEIKAPLVGTFYRTSKPDAPPYIEVGQHVSVGQVVCLIEAMKLFNEIKSETAGTIVKVLAENASPVEYGKVLFLVKPD